MSIMPVSHFTPFLRIPLLHSRCGAIIHTRVNRQAALFCSQNNHLALTNANNANVCANMQKIGRGMVKLDLWYFDA